MMFKPGEVLTIDGVEFEVVSAYQSTDHYLLKQKNAPAGYFHTMFRSTTELQDLRAQGRLLVGGWNEKVKGGNPSCLHTWKRYHGAVPHAVYDFCERCDAKKSVNYLEGDK